MKTLIRLLHLEQSDRGLHHLPRPICQKLRVIMVIIKIKKESVWNPVIMVSEPLSHSVASNHKEKGCHRM